MFESPGTGIYHPDVKRFGREMAPKIVDRLGRETPVCVLSVATGGIYYGMSLADELRSHGMNVTYADLYINNGRFPPKRIVQGRDVIAVDDAINTQTTYRSVMEKLGRMRPDYGIRNIYYAVERDMTDGVADFALSRHNLLERFLEILPW